MSNTSRSDSFACWGIFVKNCVTRKVLSRIADKWTILIIGRLSERSYRFGELRRSVEGISAKVLTQVLRSLEVDGLIERTVLPGDPPGVEYTLTPLGEKLGEVALQFKEWAESHAVEVQNMRAKSSSR